MITVIAGGVGAARFLRGLLEVVPGEQVTAIVNVADDFDLHGLRICPDIDTVRSTLADDVGPQGWGRSDETWNAMAEMKHLGSQAPEGSRATDWFSLGDRDIAIHLYRTQRLAEGASLSHVTAELSAAAGVTARLLPASDDKVATRVTLRDGREIDFQEYFVGLRHNVPVESIAFHGIDSARPGPGVIEAIESADVVVIAPSNPFVSVAPVLDIDGIGAAVERRRNNVVAVSPIVGGKAIKGPADRMFAEFGSEPSVVSVAEMWHRFATRIVVDEADSELASSVERLGMSCTVTNTVMSDIDAAKTLAAAVIGR